MTNQVKFILDETQLPRDWYNILADAPWAAEPVLHPGTGQPVGPEDLAPLFPMDLIAQEVTTERYVEIPEEVRDLYRLYRPTPSIVPTVWSAVSTRPLTFITSTRA